ncbi:hypothetical protein PYCC9005_003910 [Savitreella phatthalungensis]
MLALAAVDVATNRPNASISSGATRRRALPYYMGGTSGMSERSTITAADRQAMSCRPNCLSVPWVHGPESVPGYGHEDNSFKPLLYALVARPPRSSHPKSDPSTGVESSGSSTHSTGSRGGPRAATSTGTITVPKSVKKSAVFALECPTFGEQFVFGPGVGVDGDGLVRGGYAASGRHLRRMVESSFGMYRERLPNTWGAPGIHPGGGAAAAAAAAPLSTDTHSQHSSLYRTALEIPSPGSPVCTVDRPRRPRVNIRQKDPSVRVTLPRSGAVVEVVVCRGGYCSFRVPGSLLGGGKDGQVEYTWQLRWLEPIGGTSISSSVSRDPPRLRDAVLRKQGEKAIAWYIPTKDPLIRDHQEPDILHRPSPSGRSTPIPRITSSSSLRGQFSQAGVTIDRESSRSARSGGDRTPEYDHASYQLGTLVSRLDLSPIDRELTVSTFGAIYGRVVGAVTSGVDLAGLESMLLSGHKLAGMSWR